MKDLHFKDGIKDGLTVGLGYISVSFALGVWAVELGVPAFIAVLASMTNLTSAGEIAGLEAISVGASVISIMLGQLIINSRYFLMSITLNQRLSKSFNTPARLFYSAFVTDEIFGVAISKNAPITRGYMRGLIIFPYLGWVLGTAFGALAGNVLPNEIVLTLNIAIYAMFIAVFIPPTLHDRGILFAVLLSTALSCAVYYIPLFSGVPNGLRYVTIAFVAAIIISFVAPAKDGGESEKTLEERHYA